MSREGHWSRCLKTTSLSDKAPEMAKTMAPACIPKRSLTCRCKSRSKIWASSFSHRCRGKTRCSYRLRSTATWMVWRTQGITFSSPTRWCSQGRWTTSSTHLRDLVKTSLHQPTSLWTTIIPKIRTSSVTRGTIRTLCKIWTSLSSTTRVGRNRRLFKIYISKFKIN